MKTELCSTCKWWGCKDWAYQEENGYKVCTNSKLGDYAQSIDDEKPMTPDNIADDALTSVWQEMGAPLTGPKFGCVHHEL